MATIPQGYEVKSSGSDFLKLQNGNNKIRIISDIVVGVEGWKDIKPFRRGGMDAVIDPSEVDMDALTDKPKIHDFMAMYVYNHTTGKIEIASFTQATIRKEIVKYAVDSEWGDLEKYDLTITRTGDSMKTRYSVSPSPAKPLAKAIQQEVDDAKESFDLKTALTLE